MHCPISITGAERYELRCLDYNSCSRIVVRTRSAALAERASTSDISEVISMHSRSTRFSVLEALDLPLAYSKVEKLTEKIGSGHTERQVDRCGILEQGRSIGLSHGGETSTAEIEADRISTRPAPLGFPRSRSLCAFSIVLKETVMGCSSASET